MAYLAQWNSCIYSLEGSSHGTEFRSSKLREFWEVLSRSDGHGLAKHPRDNPSLTSPEVSPWHGSQVSVLDGERGGGLSCYYGGQKCEANVQK